MAIGGLGLGSWGRDEGEARAALPVGVDASAARIARLLEGHTDRTEEREVLSILSSASDRDLDGIVQRVDLGALVESLDDRLIGPDSRSDLLRLLSSDRLDALSVASRTRLVDALQGRVTDPAMERAIRDVFLGTRGEDLTALKNGIDAGGTSQDLARLIYHDIDSASVRREILEHIRREADRVPGGELKVLSDVDDTFYASLNDHRYPPKTVYPGVKQLWAELDRGPGPVPSRPGDMSFLTARPTDRFGVLESLTRHSLEERGVEEPHILGSETLDVTTEAMAAGKLENLRRLRALYPEYDVAFIGDSGQGDAAFGQTMRERFGDDVKGVFIHDVTGLSAEQRAEHADRGITVFDTYAGAAASAFEQGLIDDAGLERVARAAVTELGAIRFLTTAQRDARRADLARDLERVNAHLPPDRQVQLRP